MFDQLTPSLQQPAQAVKAKWDGFLPKIGQRVNEVVVEADTGLDDLIANHTLDPGPLGAAFSALQARFNGLGKKIDEAWEKIDREFDQVRDRDDVTPKDYPVLGHIWAGMRQQYAQAKEHIDISYETIQIKKSAAWARMLWTQMQAEVGQPVPCGQCGSPIQVTVHHQASNVTCGHCKAVTTVYPGMAAGLLFQGNGIHALAQEGSYDAWLAQWRAEKKYKSFRVPITRDREEYVHAARTYYTKYYEIVKQANPGFDGDVPKAVEAKLAHYSAYDYPVEQATRAKYQIVVDACRTGNAQAVQMLLRSGAATELQRIIRIDENGMREIITKGFKSDYDLDDCVWTVFEHGDARGAMMLLEMQHAAEGEDEPKLQWVGKQMARLSRDVLSRG